MGLVNGDDTFLTEWNASILGPHGVSAVNRMIACFTWGTHNKLCSPQSSYVSYC